MKPDLLQELTADNPGVQQIELTVFLNALTAYREATANLKKNGTIVLHPRTGQPLENPYLKVQTQMGAVLSKMRMIESDRALALLDEYERDNPPAVAGVPDL